MALPDRINASTDSQAPGGSLAIWLGWIPAVARTDIGSPGKFPVDGKRSQSLWLEAASTATARAYRTPDPRACRSTPAKSEASWSSSRWQWVSNSMREGYCQAIGWNTRNTFLWGPLLSKGEMSFYCSKKSTTPVRPILVGRMGRTGAVNEDGTTG